MKKRLLNCFASDFAKMSKLDLKNAIKASEGRTVLSENVAPRFSVGHDVTNSEVARAFGADLILLNGVDVFDINISGLPKTDEPIKLLKKLVGRPVGINLEPVDNSADMLEETLEISKGRQCSKETLIKAQELGFDFICLTGNPGTGVTNTEILKSLKMANEYFKGLIIAGKMHGAGVNEEIIDEDIVEKMIEFGADIILIPAVGTVPGFTSEKAEKIVKFVHSKDGLVLSAIGTSQESASKETIRNIAIMNKIIGVDIQHIGDAGYSGLAPYENILELSIAIRGVRHTIHMISGSILR